jgi:hypothetical protein
MRSRRKRPTSHQARIRSCATSSTLKARRQAPQSEAEGSMAGSTLGAGQPPRLERVPLREAATRAAASGRRAARRHGADRRSPLLGRTQPCSRERRRRRCRSQPSPSGRSTTPGRTSTIGHRPPSQSRIRMLPRHRRPAPWASTATHTTPRAASWRLMRMPTRTRPSLPTEMTRHRSNPQPSRLCLRLRPCTPIRQSCRNLSRPHFL